jgi:hypothetical protein
MDQEGEARDLGKNRLVKKHSIMLDQKNPPN